MNNNLFLLMCIIMAGCIQKGAYHRPCTDEGKCNQSMVCNSGFCMLPEELKPKENPYDLAGNFCTKCLTQCGAAGLKRCEFSDTSVWGSKPSVCECRQ